MNKMSDEHKLKISIAHKGMKKPWSTGKQNIGKKHSEEWKLKSSNAMKKENIKRIQNGTHNFWKGGITSLSIKIRNSFKYRLWRSDIFTKDSFTCQYCYKKGGLLEAHHIIQFAEILHSNNIKTFEQAINCEELWNINNGITLCQKCHGETASNNKNYYKKHSVIK